MKRKYMEEYKERDNLYKLFSLFAEHFSGDPISLTIESDRSGEFTHWPSVRQEDRIFSWGRSWDNFERGIEVLKEIIEERKDGDLLRPH